MFLIQAVWRLPSNFFIFKKFTNLNRFNIIYIDMNMYIWIYESALYFYTQGLKWNRKLLFYLLQMSLISQNVSNIFSRFANVIFYCKYTFKCP